MTGEERASFTVSDSEAGERLDRFMAVKIEGTSVRKAALVAATGAVRVNGHRTAKGHRLCAGDVVEIPLSSLELLDADFVPGPDPDVQVTVLLRDGRILVADKAPGIHTAPVKRGDKGTLLSGVLALEPALARVRGWHVREPGLLHRLDRDTSGVCLFALDQDAFDRLRTASDSDLVVKDYHVVVAGKVQQGPPTIEAIIDPGGARGKRVRVDSVRRISSTRLAPVREEDGARIVRMRVETTGEADGATRLRVKLTRGFRHQIRAVLAAMGHPVVGDTVYISGEAEPASRPASLPGHGMLLHASRIVFPHPDDGKMTRVDSPPARLDDAWESLRSRGWRTGGASFSGDES